MPEINYKDLEKHLSKLKKEQFPPVWLIYGEEFLYKTAFDNVMNILLPGSSRNLNYEAVDNDNVYDAIERVNTFSMMSGVKVVSLLDSRIFYSKQDDNSLLEKIKTAFEAKEMKKAAKFFTSFIGIKKLSFDDIEGDKREKSLEIDSEYMGDGKWLDELITYCQDKGLSPAAPQDNAGDLQKAVEKGFPGMNYLIITTDMIDKRRGLFKVINEKGMLINCSVPKGSTRADKMAQDAVLNERMHSILSKNGKSMDRTAYQTLCEMTGFDLRTFSSNLEKLVSYVGGRQKITADDVGAVLKRTRQDPIYELTGALSDRNIESSLFFLESLISEGLFPLQILAAMINQMRKLLLVKGFMESPSGKAWRRGMPYNQFQQSVMPVILEYDQALINQLKEWDQMLSPDEDENEGKKKKKKSKVVSDLVIAKNPRSPYPVYLTLQKCEKFTRDELIKIMELLSQMDLQMKTTGRNPRMALEEAVFHICRSRNPNKLMRNQ